ncbi:succinylglutamate-semialdehyde dehydrogenase [Pirellulaceae bacterium SH467]
MSYQERISPVDGSVTWRGSFASPQQVASSIDRSLIAKDSWKRVTLETREGVCKRFAERLRHHAGAIATTISMEMGKPYWEAHSEVVAAASKVEHTLDALRNRRSMWSDEQVTSESVIRFRPIGLIAVLGPFNLPLHLPGAHIVPALLMGNGVLFKPSEKAPAVGDWIQRVWEEAGLPTGVLHTLHGGAEVARQIVNSTSVDGVCFTGSYRVGAELHRMLAGRPECLLALEMGGNNPLIIDRVSDLDAALHVLIASCFITSGQRCTCARRVIVLESALNRELIRRFVESIPRIRVGLPFETPGPFMGPLVGEDAVQSVLSGEERFAARGAIPLIRCQTFLSHPNLIRPGLWERSGEEMEDDEVFGPLATIEYVEDLDDAIASANRTRYGLSAGLISDSREHFDQFVNEVRAGILNWNSPTTGATGKLPFGGLGSSGNHRSSGYFAIDYCSDPIASVQARVLQQPNPLPHGLDSVFSSFRDVK